MTLTECKQLMRRYRECAEMGDVQFDWRTTARWSLRHSWACEENDKLRLALRDATGRAEAAEAALAQCRAWRQEDADNLNHCIRAKQTLAADRAMLRRALAQLVGADTVEELQNMEAIMRVAPAPAKDRAAAIDAIHALIEVQP